MRNKAEERHPPKPRKIFSWKVSFFPIIPTQIIGKNKKKRETKCRINFMNVFLIRPDSKCGITRELQVSKCHRSIAANLEKRNSFTLVSFSLVRKYCVNALYALKNFDKNFDV